MTRWIRVAFVMAVGAGAAAIACGSGGSKQNPDAKMFLDARNPDSSNPGDGSNPGSGSNVSALGHHCTAGSASGSDFPQSDCPDGYECMDLNGGHDTWCSKKCMKGSGDTCGRGYTGTGEGQCLWTIGFGSGGSADFCGILCAFTLDGSNACPNCDDTCPSALTCSGTITFSGTGSPMGSACF
jgi:hypothetical protein